MLVDEVFKASGPNTVAASTAKRADVSCIQIEINSKYLCKDFPEYAYDRIRDALEECITSLNSNFADHVYDGGSTLVRVVDETLPFRMVASIVLVFLLYSIKKTMRLRFSWNVLNKVLLMDISIVPQDSLDVGQIAITKHVQRTLKIADHADYEVFIRKAPYARFDKIRVQSIDKVSSEDVVISTKMIEGGAVQELLEGADLFGIKDVVTNQSFIVKANHLVFDDSLDAGVIKLNRRSVYC